MRVPQTLALFKALSLASVLALVAFGAPVLAEDEEDPPYRPTLFSCGTDPEQDRSFLNLSAIELDYNRYTDLRFERLEDNGERVVYAYPPEGIDSKTAFLFSHSDGPEGYLVSVRWIDGGRNYVYYSLAIPADPDVEDDAGGGAAGLVISQDGKLIEQVDCAERPYMFISYMRDAMSCDTDNPYGLAACEEYSVKRETPLDVETIGIVP